MAMFFTGMFVGVVVGVFGFVLFVNTVVRRPQKSTPRQRAVLVDLRREFDKVSREAGTVGDDVVGHRVALLRAASPERVLHPSLVEVFRADVGRLLAQSVRDATPARFDMLRALDRADEHAETLVVSLRPYLEREVP